jgi:hypothetical protein
MRVLTITLLYSGRTHGWKVSTFHKFCDKKGPTLTVMRSKAGRVFSGFTMQSWDSETKYKKGLTSDFFGGVFPLSSPIASVGPISPDMAEGFMSQELIT